MEGGRGGGGGGGEGGEVEREVKMNSIVLKEHEFGKRCAYIAINISQTTVPQYTSLSVDK